MEALAVLVLIFLLFTAVILPVWMFVKIHQQDRDLGTLNQRVGSLETEIQQLRSSTPPADATTPPPAVLITTAAKPAVAAPQPVALPLPPPLPTPPRQAPVPSVTAEPPPLVDAPPSRPPALPQRASVPAESTIDWEQFMGAKLFAWLGGLALFLGVAFFVKYSVEHQWIPPTVRMMLGFLFGAGLVVGGLFVPRERYRITAQTLVGAGVVSLYAVIFACDAIYHFPAFGLATTFALMALITATAFVLAVRLDAPVVAILGLLGGFLTPVLLSTGRDNPAGLFSYLALLDLGLAGVALRRRWFYLVPLGAAATVLMMIAWAQAFYVPEKVSVAMTVCLVFAALYLATYAVARWRKQTSSAILTVAVLMPLMALAFAVAFLDSAAVGARPGLLFSFILAADLLLLAVAWLDERAAKIHALAGLATFALLALWIARYLTDERLPWALAACLVCGGLHAIAAVLIGRRWAESATAAWTSQLFPPLSLLLLLVPLMKLDTVPLLFWPAVLFVDVLAVAIAALSVSLVVLAAVLGLTLLATGIFIFKAPVALELESPLLAVIGGFALFFVGASAWLGRKLAATTDRAQKNGSAQLSAFAVVLPFLLLVMVCGRLAVPDPSAVFGLGLLLVVLALGLTAFTAGGGWLPACALAGIGAVELAWQNGHFNAHAPGKPLAWYLGIYALFAIFPFLFRRRFAAQTGPWAAAALGGVAQFWLVYQVIKLAWPNGAMGVVPALFAIAPLVSFRVVLKSGADGRGPAEPEEKSTSSADGAGRSKPAPLPVARLNRLAWFGGVTLGFVTLVFPIQFERQWLTVAWALEGAALLWLFRRVPHPGVRATGFVLLVTAFVRLALNPAVLAYHMRGETAVFNWYLYSYGLTTVALFAGARLLAPPRERVLGCNAPALLATLGTILAFLLLNLEIADYFTPPGARTLAFQFSGNFARDMSYTIAWALFALGLLAAGIWRTSRAARYAAIALLSVALLKLFLHDLAQLAQLYRIGALFAVAVIAILASLAYQRFLPGEEKKR